jgi:peptidoglycan/xylan/chitin deacetylase (PgdA/CDA1 family)
MNCALRRKNNRLTIYGRVVLATLLLIVLLLAGCGRDEQPPPDRNNVATGEPEVVALTEPIAATVPLTNAGSLTQATGITESAAASVSPAITAPPTSTMTLTASHEITSAIVPSASTNLSETTVISPVDALTARLGMTVTRPITAVSPGASTDGLTNALDVSTTVDAPISPLPAPGKVLLPTPTPDGSPSTAAPPLPTPDGVARTAYVPILMYHYLSEPPADADIYRLDLSVTPDLFAAHLDAMQAAGYTTISLYDLLDHLVQGTPLPDKPVIITFDDGYRDNYKNAFPRLRERGMQATFFVVTDFIDEGRPQYMTWDMAREMLAGGMSIESHGRNHVTLKGQDDDYLVWQALGSLETIEYELGARPRFVSYPAGEYDQRTIDIFHSANYWAGVTTVQGATHSSDDLFQLRRVRVRGTTTPEELLALLEVDW